MFAFTCELEQSDIKYSKYSHIHFAGNKQLSNIFNMAMCFYLAIKITKYHVIRLILQFILELVKAQLIAENQFILSSQIDLKIIYLHNHSKIIKKVLAWHLQK